MAKLKIYIVGIAIVAVLIGALVLFGVSLIRENQALKEANKSNKATITELQADIRRSIEDLEKKNKENEGLRNASREWDKVLEGDMDAQKFLEIKMPDAVDRSIPR